MRIKLKYFSEMEKPLIEEFEGTPKEFEAFEKKGYTTTKVKQVKPVQTVAPTPLMQPPLQSHSRMIPSQQWGTEDSEALP